MGIILQSGDGNDAHFDAILAELVAGSEYAEAYATDLLREDAVGNTADVRVNMYNLIPGRCEYYPGFRLFMQISMGVISIAYHNRRSSL